MGELAVPLLIAGTAVSAYSVYQQNKSAQQQSRAQAAWSRYNAQVAQREAEAERKAAAFESKQQRRQGAMLLARQRALIGASGINGRFSASCYGRYCRSTCP